MPSWCETISLFLSSPQPPYSIPPIVLYPWLTLMYCVKVKKFENIKVWNNCLTKTGVVHDLILCVMKMEHSQTIWFCRDKLSLAMLCWEDIIALLVWLKYYCFYVNIKLLFWILWIWTFMPQ
jgi:hypothetical protein